MPPSSSSPSELLRCLFSLPCFSRPFASYAVGGAGNGRPVIIGSGDWLVNERRGAATGGWKVKLGLNSEAVALSGLLEALCELWTGVSTVVGCCHEGTNEVLFAPKVNGFANGFKEAGLRPAEGGGAISAGRDG